MQTIPQSKINEIIKGFPQDLFYIKNSFKALQRHLTGGTEHEKLKAAYKHLLLCQYIHDELMKVSKNVMFTDTIN